MIQGLMERDLGLDVERIDLVGGSGNLLGSGGGSSLLVLSGGNISRDDQKGHRCQNHEKFFHNVFV